MRFRISLFIFLGIFLFSSFLTSSPVSAVTTRDIPYYEKLVKNLKAQIKILDKKVIKLEKENKELKRLGKDTKYINPIHSKTTKKSEKIISESKAIDSTGEAKKLSKAYTISNVPSDPTIHPRFKGFEVQLSSENIDFYFNGSDEVMRGKGSKFIENLQDEKEYSYRWIYREEGREDSIFTGKIKTASLAQFVYCLDVPYRADSLFGTKQFGIQKSSASFRIKCEIPNYPSIKFISVNVDIYNLASVENAKVDLLRIYDKDVLHKTEIENIILKERDNKTIILPLLSSNGVVDQTVFARSFSTDMYLRINNLKFVDTITGKEYAAFK